jgi:acyl-CoA thioesterase FadM
VPGIPFGKPRPTRMATTTVHQGYTAKILFVAVSEPASIVVKRRIEWSDTDASGWYHNTAALRLIEEAEHILLDRLGILHEVIARVPRVHISIDFRRVLRFWDEVEVAIRVAEVGESSITYGFEMRHDGEVCAEGAAVAVLVSAEGQPTPWLEEHRKILLTSGPLKA